MARILLDTTVLIDALRGRGAADRVRSLRRRGDQPLTCAINVEEVCRGLRSDEVNAADRLFAGLRVIPLAAAEGIRAGTWRRDFAAQGVTLSQADCLIAAATFTAGARLATANVRDFPMPELGLEHWPAGQ